EQLRLQPQLPCHRPPSPLGKGIGDRSHRSQRSDAMTTANDPFGARKQLPLPGAAATYYSLDALAARGITAADLQRLPFTVRILLENLLRQCDGKIATEEDVLALAHWRPTDRDYAFLPARVLLQD